ncbi:LysR family transcriptional regulator [Thauera sp. AutoDN2]|uniref:LysR family transcriptional regulator n=1 Tax=Thauera sp. AutoDN2 TaxID=3416051 RepID=UPI003F4CA27F
MDLRCLRCFVAVAEELHFTRAAARLHIEQSPLSRTIRKLESDVGASLFERGGRGTHLTWAGQVLLRDARRVFAVLEQARINVKAAATGYRGMLRIALSDGIAQTRLTALLALCREEEPDVGIRLFETPFAAQVRGMRDDSFDAGFAQSDEAGEGIHCETLWSDPLVAAIPNRHPLLAFKQIPLEELLKYPLVMYHPEACHGASRQIKRILRSTDIRPNIAERAVTLELMLTLVAAGYGLGFATASQISICRHPEIVTRPLADGSARMTTFLLRPHREPSEPLQHFIDRARLLRDNSCLPEQA